MQADRRAAPSFGQGVTPCDGTAPGRSSRGLCQGRAGSPGTAGALPAEGALCPDEPCPPLAEARAAGSASLARLRLRGSIHSCPAF